MSIELKIKSKHLGLEAQVIRFEEKKLLKKARWLRKRQLPTEATENLYRSINLHRKFDVRIENRATFLARAFIAKPYLEVEASRISDKEYNFRQQVIPRLVSMLKKYHSTDIDTNRVWEWINA